MYKKNQNHQFSLGDFNQPMGLKLDPENKWIKKAAMIPWDEIEAVYADLFPSDCGMPAKPLRMALGALLIQKKFGFSDRELVEQIQENLYYQYFIGLPGFQLDKFALSKHSHGLGLIMIPKIDFDIFKVQLFL